MLQIKDIVSGYGKKVVVNNISMKVKRGDFICILGSNGCGKTTLLKTILGFIKPFNGEIYVDDISIGNLKERELAKKISYIPQAHVPPFPFTVKDVVIMGRTPYLGKGNNPSMEDEKLAHESMERLGILKFENNPYTELSGGQQQLTMIARALVQNTDFIFMDEPTANLDFGNEYKVLEEVYSLAKLYNKGVIMVTHNPNHVFSFADKVIIMKNGKIYKSGYPEDKITEDVLKDIYNTEVKVVGVPIDDSYKTKVCVPNLVRINKKYNKGEKDENI